LQLARNSLRGLRPLRSDNRPKSEDEGAARPCKALRSSTAQKGPKSNTVVCFANFPCPSSLRIGRDGQGPRAWSRCEARRIWCSGPRGWRRGAQGFGAARDSALRPLTSRRLSERRERSEQSEFGARPQTPSTAEKFGQRPNRHRRVAFSLVTFFWRSKRKLLPCRGHIPTRPHAVNNHHAKTTQNTKSNPRHRRTGNARSLQRPRHPQRQILPPRRSNHLHPQRQPLPPLRP